MDRLSFVSREPNDGPIAPVHDRDFAVNGRPLAPVIATNQRSVFSGASRERARDYARALWPRDRSAARAALYVCPQCGDLGCGYFSVQVQLVEDCVAWSEPGWESSHGSGVRPFAGEWRDLWFDRLEYRTALSIYL